MPDADNFSHTFFDPDSKRAKEGISFQEAALQELRDLGVNAVFVGEWLKDLDDQLSDRQLWMLEKTWGDIVCKTKSGKSVFLECVTAAGETTPFPTSKIGNFSGSNKWYLFGWNSGFKDVRHFVPSEKWNAYVEKIDKRVQREHDVVVIVNRYQYASMRCGISGLRKFCEENCLIPQHEDK